MIGEKMKTLIARLTCTLLIVLPSVGLGLEPKTDPEAVFRALLRLKAIAEDSALQYPVVSAGDGKFGLRKYRVKVAAILVNMSCLLSQKQAQLLYGEKPFARLLRPSIELLKEAVVDRHEANSTRLAAIQALLDTSIDYAFGLREYDFNELVRRLDKSDGYRSSIEKELIQAREDVAHKHQAYKAFGFYSDGPGPRH